MILAHCEILLLMFPGRLDTDTTLQIRPTDTNKLRTAMANNYLVAETLPCVSVNDLIVWNHTNCSLKIKRVLEL